ncbi:protein bicaudal C 1-like protein [Leptotrombidium deliense]|uniref:Protein bicaudal C 1-like protein n=1 Tax=Leptotrombidium deliense TaxID=299467 RepID=A0A443SRG1_9ACAR|nr:protein bicaudal C 1-like protein [Leptotrombidium deliense]
MQSSAVLSSSENFVSVGSMTTLLPNGQLEERVKVDRKKFEQMLNGENLETGHSEDFFKRVMHKTNATVSWPPKLKVGTKSKKDPHIRITGSAEEIGAAKDIIMVYLDSRRNRVTLKMDVAFTDHSHIIGKGGRSIQKVMDDTGCHIHFPDSNRTSTVEKSNQVSIAGTASGAEQARCRIRELLPLTVIFDVPVNTFPSAAFDTSAPAIQSIQQTYGLTISMRLSQRSPFTDYSMVSNNSCITVCVRGTRGQILALRQGVIVLIEYLLGASSKKCNIPLTVCIEIAAQHHSFVIGRAECNVRTIMQQTGVVITFPENAVTESPLASSQRRSTVLIRGSNFDSVFLAWQELLGYLPLVLIFDLREGQELDAAQITQLMEQLKVSILIKPKQKQNLKSIMVRGQERDSRLLFEVRRQILQLDESEVPVCCDQHAWFLASKLLSMYLPYCNVPGVPATKAMPVPPFSPTITTGTVNKQISALQPLLSQALNVFPPKMIEPIEPKKVQPSVVTPNLLTTPSLNSHCPESPVNIVGSQNAKDCGRSELWPDSSSLDYSDRKLQALKAMKMKPNTYDVRTPTSVWSGLGFSQTTPSNVFKNQLTADWNNSAVASTKLGQFELPSQSNFWQSAKINPDFRCTNTLSQTIPELTPTTLKSMNGSLLSPTFSDFNSEVEQFSDLDLNSILTKLGLSKHIDSFHQHNVDFKTFVTLNDADLQELGIPYFGRRKLLNAIFDLKSSFQTQHEPSTTVFEAAPGAERSRRSKLFLRN